MNVHYHPVTVGVTGAVRNVWILLVAITVSVKRDTFCQPITELV